MELFEKIDELINPNTDKMVIAITGGGGKTTTLVELGKFYRAKNKKVLLTTTTKIQAPRYFNFEVDHVFQNEETFFFHTPKEGESVVFVDKHIMNAKKAVSPRLELFPHIINKYDVIIIEADGARHLPCKIHTERDPVMVEGITSVIAMAGLSSYNDMAANVCMGENSTEKVDLNYYQKLIDNKEGLLKGIKQNHKAVILFNQMDLIDEKEAKTLFSLKTDVPIVVGSVLTNKVLEL